MIKRYACSIAACLAAVLMALAAVTAPAHAADGPHRAGLVIVHSGGRVSQRCVEFSEETIDGLALLQRSGLDLNVDATSSAGVAVCRIDNEGCTFPEQPCFCECLGASCIYWSYWRRSPGGEWQYANIGASSAIVSDGDIDAWVWGAGNGAASLLPPVTFDDICVPVAPTATATATFTPQPIVMWYPSDTPEPTLTSTAAATLVPMVPVATATSTATMATPSSTPVAPPAAGRNLASSPAVPTSTAGPAGAFTPMPTTHRGTPMITTPTTFPAQAKPLPVGVTPARAVMATALPEVTATSTPAEVAQVVLPVASHPSATPTFLLGSNQRVTSTPAPQRPAGEASSRIPIPAMILAGVGAGGAVFLLLTRRTSH